LADGIVIIDIAENECTFRKIGQLKFGYNAICFDGDNFWLALSYPADGEAKLLKWDDKSRFEYVTVPANREGMKKDIGTTKHLLYASGYVNLVPNGLNSAYRINVKNSGFGVWDALRPECESESAPELYDKFNAVWQNRDTIYALGSRSRRLTVYDTVSDSVRIVAITAGTNRIPVSALMKDADFCDSPEDFIYSEGWAVGTEEFIDIATNFIDAEFRKKQANVSKEANMINTQNAGNSIYGYCKDLALGV
jgi:hypothetical protein